MIKVFISVPMKGRKKEDIDYSIRKMKRIARAYLTENDIEADNIDFINTIVSENPPKDVDEKIWYLGSSIQLLAKADYLVTVSYEDSYGYSGCEIERHTFYDYKGGNKIIQIPIAYILSDTEKLNECKLNECTSED